LPFLAQVLPALEVQIHQQAQDAEDDTRQHAELTGHDPPDERCAGSCVRGLATKRGDGHVYVLLLEVHSFTVSLAPSSASLAFAFAQWSLSMMLRNQQAALHTMQRSAATARPIR